MAITLDINSDAAWNAITWYSDNHWHWAEPKFQEGFEHMFHCRIVSEPASGEHAAYFAQVPTALAFDKEKHYTAFLLRWS